MKQSKKILVVDDDPGIRKMFLRFLKRNGYDVMLCNNGPSALEVLKSEANDIDLVVLDILLPGSNGLEVYDVIRRSYPQMKVVIASVYPKEEQGFFIKEADDYYYKSEKLEALLDKVNNLIGMNSYTGGI